MELSHRIRPPPPKDEGFVSEEVWEQAEQAIYELCSDLSFKDEGFVSEEVWEQAKQTIYELFSDLSFEERMWLLADLTKRCCRQIKL